MAHGHKLSLVPLQDLWNWLRRSRIQQILGGNVGGLPSGQIYTPPAPIGRIPVGPPPILRQDLRNFGQEMDRVGMAAAGMVGKAIMVKVILSR